MEHALCVSQLAALHVEASVVVPEPSPPASMVVPVSPPVLASVDASGPHGAASVKITRAVATVSSSTSSSICSALTTSPAWTPREHETMSARSLGWPARLLYRQVTSPPPTRSILSWTPCAAVFVVAESAISLGTAKRMGGERSRSSRG